MKTERLVRPSGHRPRPLTPKRTGTATGWMLLCTALGLCSTLWLLIQWGSSTTAASASQPQVLTAETPTRGDTAAVAAVSPNGTLPDATTLSYNPDPVGTLLAVLEQQGDGLGLVGGAVLGGILLLLVVTRRMTRIPKDPLATGLGRTLTLLENDYRAGTLTPLRAMELARQAVVDVERDHAQTLADRTRAYDEAVAQLTKTQAETVAALKDEATQGVKRAQVTASEAAAREAKALQRVANVEAQVARLSRDLDLTHRQLVEATAANRTHTEELATLQTALEAAAGTLETWQDAHRLLTTQYRSLQEEYATLQGTLAIAQATAGTMTTRATTAEAEALRLGTEAATLRQSQKHLAEELGQATQELGRLRGVSLRELSITIPDRESDLVPHMASIVSFIRGATVNSGAAGGERATKPILTSWRDIRRLFQVLKGVGVRLAVPAHHAPKWLEATGAPARPTEPVQEGAETAPRLPEGVSAPDSALTDSLHSVHNGELSKDFNTSDADVILL